MLSFHSPKARDEAHPSRSDRNFGRGTYPFGTKLQHTRCHGRKGEQHMFYQAITTSVNEFRATYTNSYAGGLVVTYRG